MRVVALPAHAGKLESHDPVIIAVDLHGRYADVKRVIASSLSDSHSLAIRRATLRPRGQDKEGQSISATVEFMQLALANPTAPQR